MKTKAERVAECVAEKRCSGRVTGSEFAVQEVRTRSRHTHSACMGTCAPADAFVCVLLASHSPYQWAQCVSCGMAENEGVCVACMSECHAGHIFGDLKRTSFYCDCGACNPLCNAMWKQTELIGLRVRTGICDLCVCRLPCADEC